MKACRVNFTLNAERFHLFADCHTDKPILCLMKEVNYKWSHEALCRILQR